MRIVQAIPQHAASLRLQSMQREGGPVSPEEVAQLIKHGVCFSGVGSDGVVYGMAGLLPQWEGRAVVWAMLAYDCGPYFVQIHRAVRKFLAERPERRLEAHIDANFAAAIRWVEMLGFTRETPEPMLHFTPEGRAAYQYVRLKHG